jgi:hypothetical protein
VHSGGRVRRVRPGVAARLLATLVSAAAFGCQEPLPPLMWYRPAPGPEPRPNAIAVGRQERSATYGLAGRPTDACGWPEAGRTLRREGRSLEVAAHRSSPRTIDPAWEQRLGARSPERGVTLRTYGSAAVSAAGTETGARTGTTP